MQHLTLVRRHGNPPRRRGGVRERDAELRTMRAILLSGVTVSSRDAIVNLLMQPLSEGDVRALRTVMRRLGTLDPKSAERVQHWLVDRFGQTSSTTSTTSWSRPS
jgi:hypothetical protein